MTGELNDRSLGWLRYIWDKATTADDWSDQGEPHEWWDRYTSPPMCAFPRFDLAETAYALPVMLEATPAWREVYARIADELVERYTTFWGAIDWNTLIGPDPNVDRYPPEWLCTAPEGLRGRYDLPGWTANGVEPWGLQPDPVGADGNVFYRGWLSLTLGIRHLLSGRDDRDEPFDVVGYRNRRFTWTHARVAELISAQLDSRPQGPHCENTKVWPTCVTASALGLQLYDALHGTHLHAPYPRWLEFAKQHYMGYKPSGELDWFAFYYDPIEGRAATLPAAYSALVLLHLLYPQDPDFAAELYRHAVRTLGWDDPDHPVVEVAADPRMLSTALVLAHELGDTTTETRLRDYVEAHYQPRFFGAENDRFGFWCGIDSAWPRGQLSAMLMLTEAGAPGAWSRTFTRPDTGVHAQPTVRGVDYPTLGIRSARADPARGTLDVVTTAATPSRRGQPTRFTVDRLPDPTAVSVRVDGREHSAWRVTGSDAIELDIDVDRHRVEVAVPGVRARPTRA